VLRATRSHNDLVDRFAKEEVSDERQSVSDIGISLIVLACVFGGTLVGLFLPSRLPREHLSPGSTDVVKLGIGLIGTMSALVLGLMLSSANSLFNTEDAEFTAQSAKIVMLDKMLAHYGPETKEARDALRTVVVGMLERGRPPEAGSQHGRLEPPAGSDALYKTIMDLSPKDDEQRFAKSQALNIVIGLGQTRWLILEQQVNSISMPLLVVVVFWLVMIFMSFGLLAPHNATVVTTLFVCALSVSTAIFLILEMYSPFDGLIRISSAPLRSALSQLGQ
jgi:hypothetical protein